MRSESFNQIAVSIFIAVAVLLGMVWAGLGNASASPLDSPLPRTPVGTLVAGEEGTHPATPVPQPNPASQQPNDGAHIHLVNNAAYAGLHSVVQWADPQGNWYDVDGWQSTLTNAPLSWWVAPKDFGTGPFRWAAYDKNTRQPVAASPAFYLPCSSADSVTVSLSRNLKTSLTVANPCPQTHQPAAQPPARQPTATVLAPLPPAATQAPIFSPIATPAQ